MERRKFQRVACHLPESRWNAILNLSQGGALWQSRKSLPVGSTVTLDFPLPLQGAEQPITATANVVRVDAVCRARMQRYGLVLTEVHPPVASEIDRFVRSRKPDADRPLTMPSLPTQPSPRTRAGADRRRRVVITGLGPVTPIGVGLREFWPALLRGETGVCAVTDELSGKPYYAAPLKNFSLDAYQDPACYMRLRYLRRARQVARISTEVDRQLACIQTALKDAGFPYNREQNRIGAIIGFETSGLTANEESFAWFARHAKAHHTKSAEELLLDFYRECYVRTVGNTFPFAHLYFATSAFGLHGPSSAINNASASGLCATIQAAQQIQQGRADVMVAAAAEDHAYCLRYHYFNALRIYSQDGRIKPFDRQRAGWVLGEGGAAVVLEERDHAIRRGAKIYAEIRGGCIAHDAGDYFAPNLEVRYLTEAVEQAIQESKVDKKAIALVLPHSTATTINDIVQSDLNLAVFGDDQPYSYSFTAQLGHPMGASGVLRVVVGAMALREGVIPPTFGTEEIDCDAPVRLATEPIRRPMEAVLVSAIAFGGNNAAVVLGAV